jgi:predicted XRE-type DNA-binding protein
MIMSKEVWKNIPSLLGFYMASNLGRLKRLARNVTYPKGGVRNFPELILDNKISPTGYVQVCISIEKNRSLYMTHRLVAEAFIDNEENKPYINHKNSIRDDNRAENLEWCTSSENNQHAFDIGFGNAKSGVECHLTKITEEVVKKVYTLAIKGDMMQKDIAAMFGVSRGHVSAIKLKKAWKELTDRFDKENL